MSELPMADGAAAGPVRTQRGRPTGFSQVLRRSVAGDNEAVKQALRWYMPMMSKLVLTRLGKGSGQALSNDERIDAAGEILLNLQAVAFTKADESTITHFTNFLASVARVEVFAELDQRRRRKGRTKMIKREVERRRRMGIPVEEVSGEPDPAEQVSGEELLGVLGRFIEVELPRQLRASVVARWIEGKDEPTIARQMHIHKSMVQQHLLKASELILKRFGPTLRELAPDLVSEAKKRVEDAEAREYDKKRRFRERQYQTHRDGETTP
ncbi:MAG: hypothetical protein A3F84_20840 [Candidatus Handelsmanbacteria bacterium RIFCSPLOWO2_12_FULL_64_10]|uniref:Uncharacterized protein n=1 Tax=Handelsmanbacteria sp. (strain RIFCSPLOWO2_12_FULL_64_10) TaxID=1817868 RepID=A0A1F6D5T7_HANXR|nr:MAG: hypothetical protein A3F84_20840 [Candidatus Handelsmanbacteria bacterium RIFCSPLOWO2_12_FULL_64_10]